MSNRVCAIAALLLAPVAAAALAATPRGPTPQPPAATGRRAVLGAAIGAAAAALAPAREALAWCGETVPSWAFYLTWDENSAFPFEYDGTRGQFYCRVVGDMSREKKVVCCRWPASGRRVSEPLPTLLSRPASCPCSSSARLVLATTTWRTLRR